MPEPHRTAKPSDTTPAAGISRSGSAWMRPPIDGAMPISLDASPKQLATTISETMLREAVARPLEERARRRLELDGVTSAAATTPSIIAKPIRRAVGSALPLVAGACLAARPSRAHPDWNGSDQRYRNASGNSGTAAFSQLTRKRRAAASSSRARRRIERQPSSRSAWRGHQNTSVPTTRPRKFSGRCRRTQSIRCELSGSRPVQARRFDCLAAFWLSVIVVSSSGAPGLSNSPPIELPRSNADADRDRRQLARHAGSG